MKTQVVPIETVAEMIALQLEQGGHASLVVTGVSMLPMLRNRKDIVFLIPPAAPKVGDVIFYRRSNGKYVLHRIIALQGKDFFCCGDNQSEREFVSRRQVIAVVDEFIRKGKRYTRDVLWYRIYVALWVKLFFMRPIYIKLRRLLSSLRRYLRNKRLNKMQEENNENE